MIHFLSALIFWLIALVYTNLVAPDSLIHLVVFFVLVFAALVLTLTLFIHRRLRLILALIYFVILILLVYFHQFSWLNLILLTCLLFLSAYLT